MTTALRSRAVSRLWGRLRPVKHTSLKVMFVAPCARNRLPPGPVGPIHRGSLATYLCLMRLRDDLTRLREQILAAASAAGAERVRVFGSVARGEETPESDVDFLVTLRPGVTLLDLARLEQQLEALLGRRVDVLTEVSLQEPVRETALRQALNV